MEIRVLTVGQLGTQCYILSAHESETCIVIDPGAEPERILQAAGNRRIEAILLTHGHFDHIGAVSALMSESTSLLIHRLDAPMLSDSHLNAGLELTGTNVTTPAPTGFVADNDLLHYAGLEIRVIHTPGHTPGGVCYLCENEAFTGDTLFHHGWGRTDLAGGNQADLMASLRKLIMLTKDMSIHPGHED